jgi:hypothetical protein
VVEHYLDTVGVGSSILPAPTRVTAGHVGDGVLVLVGIVSVGVPLRDGARGNSASVCSSGRKRPNSLGPMTRL